MKHSKKMYGGSKKKMMMYGGKKKMMKDGGKLKMVMKDGKKVPFFAADGKGKMQFGGPADLEKSRKSGEKMLKNIKKKAKKAVKDPYGSLRKVGKKLGLGKKKMQVGGSPDDVSRLIEQKRERQRDVIKRKRKKEGVMRDEKKMRKKLTRPIKKGDIPGVKMKKGGEKKRMGGKKKMMMGGKNKMGMGGKKMMYQMGGFIEPGVFDLDRD